MTKLKEKLYKLPYSKNNNPNGFIELTTFCQLKCPSCYRGCDLSQHRPEHKRLENIKKEIDDLIAIRNIQTLAISGGEPLLHPQLDEVLQYATEKKLDILMFTNGLLLDKNKLEHLKKYNVIKIIIHLDKYQGREATGSEEGVNIIREQYCSLFREVKGITLGFIMWVSKDNIRDLDILIPFFKKNSDIISFVVLTILADLVGENALTEEYSIDPEEVFLRAKNLFGINYSTYLGKTKSDKISWLLAFSYFLDGKLLGSTDSQVTKINMETYYQKNKKYLFAFNDIPLNFKTAFRMAINKSILKIFLKYLIGIIKTGKTKVDKQQLLIIATPTKVGGSWDLCDGCPDAILYNGDLVPSCLLERIKNGEDIKTE